MAAPIRLSRLPLSLLTIGSLLLAATGGAMTLGCSDDEASGTTSPWSLPPFVMELETFSDGTRDGTIALTYISEDEWLWEVFDATGSLRSSQRLESGRLTITHRSYGIIHSEEVDPAVRTVPPAPDWFISPDTARGRGASRLHGLAAFERELVITCGANDHRCAPGETLRMTQRVDYDAATGIPIGYTETHNGVVVRTVRATRLTVE